MVHHAAVTLSRTNQLRVLDTVHDRTYTTLNGHTRRFDQKFAADPKEALATPDSRFRAAFFTTGIKRGSDYSVKIDPDIDADIDLPNLEKRLKLFLQSSDLGELPGRDPEERKNNVQAGLRHIAKSIHVESDVGVKGRIPPRGFAKIEWKPNWFWEDWMLYPRQRVFYETDDGFGELSSLNVSRWLWKQTFLKSVTAGRWTETSEGLEWEQSLIAGYVWSYLEEKHEGKVVDDRQTAQGISLRASAFGHKSADWLTDRYRVTVTYRRPLHKKWIYLELATGVEWEDKYDWEATPMARVGLDCLFWGPADR
jgi:hypothetical protein